MQTIPAPPPSNGKKGRPRYQPDLETADRIQKLAALGLTEGEIGAMVKLTVVIVRKYYKEHILIGRSQGMTAVAGALMKNAVNKNNVKAQMFYLQCKGGWNPNKSDDLSEFDIENATTEQLRAILTANKAARNRT